jgi:hypothetical protein
LSSASLPTDEATKKKKKGRIVGELYVMVLKAEDLKTPTSDVLVFVNASQHRNTQRSLDVPTTARPTLNEEFVLQVTNPAEPLIVELIVGFFSFSFRFPSSLLTTLTLLECWRFSQYFSRFSYHRFENTYRRETG